MDGLAMKKESDPREAIPEWPRSHSTGRRFISWADTAFEFLGGISGAIIVAVALAIAADVLLRWLFSSPIRGMYEMAEMGIALGMAAAMVLATSRANHISTDMLSSLSSHVRGVRLLGALIGLVALACFATYLFDHAVGKLEHGETSFLRGIPLGPVWVAIACLFATTVAAQSLIVWRAAEALRDEGQMRDIALAAGMALLLASSAWMVMAAGDGQRPGMLVTAGFALLGVLAVLQVPLGLALGLTGIFGLWAVAGPDAAAILAGNALAGALGSVDLAAVPLFLLLGGFVIASGFATDVFTAARMITGRLRGGLAMTAILGSGLFGAICGSSVATTAVIGRVAVDEMLENGYAPRLATGSIAAGGTLGALLPPSVPLIIYCLIAEVSIQQAFIAAIVPGLLALILYLIAITILVRAKPELAPPPDARSRFDFAEMFARSWKPGVLFAIIIGGLYGGVFTVQEAAAVGCVMSFLFWLASGKASIRSLVGILQDAAASSAVLYLLFIGATVFGAFLNVADVTTAIFSLLDPATMPHLMIILILVVLYLVLGSVFDAVAAMVVTLPLTLPVLAQMDVNLLWWGIVLLTLVEVGMITPPMGMNVFVMKGMVGQRVALPTIFRGVIPFLMADAVRLCLLLAFPVLALWLPSVL